MKVFRDKRGGRPPSGPSHSASLAVFLLPALLSPCSLSPGTALYIQKRTKALFLLYFSSSCPVVYLHIDRRKLAAPQNSEKWR
ncbi:unnamed protein product [Caenorhabditis brenneri]